MALRRLALALLNQPEERLRASSRGDDGGGCASTPSAVPGRDPPPPRSSAPLPLPYDPSALGLRSLLRALSRPPRSRWKLSSLRIELRRLVLGESGVGGLAPVEGRAAACAPEELSGGWTAPFAPCFGPVGVEGWPLMAAASSAVAGRGGSAYDSGGGGGMSVPSVREKLTTLSASGSNLLGMIVEMLRSLQLAVLFAPM